MAHAFRFLLLTVLVAVISPSLAVADRYVAVSAFRGDDSAARKVERDVTAIVRREARVVDMTAERVDGVVYGTIIRHRANFFMLHVLVVEKASGKRFEEIAVRLSAPRLRGSTRREVAELLRDYIADLARGPEEKPGKRLAADAEPAARSSSERKKPARKVKLEKDSDGYDTMSEDAPLTEELLEEEEEVGDSDSRASTRRSASNDDDDDDSAADDDDDDDDDDDVADDDASERLGIENDAESNRRPSTLSMEIISGFNVIERTLADNGNTAVSDLFARADIYPFPARKDLLRYLGGVLEVSQPIGDGGAGGDMQGTPGMAPAPGPPTQLVAGAATRYRYQRNLFVVLAKADAGLRFATGGGQSDVGPIVRGSLATGAAWKTFLFLAEAANFTATGDSQSDRFNLVPNLIVDWRLRNGGFHPFAIAVVPLHSDVRASAPLILQLGIRYEQ